MSRRLRVFTWHVHGSYLYYLAQAPIDIYIPVRAQARGGYGGRAGSFPWPDNVIEVAADEVKNHWFDAVIFQSRDNYLKDQFEIFSPRQRSLPRVYIEHDPPREHPTDTRHVVDDEDVLVVHVTAFNRLMWDNGSVPTAVVEHGVVIPDGVTFAGDLAKGITVVNDLATRGRRLGNDIFTKARAECPLDLVGMNSDALGGLGEVVHPLLPAFMSRYRFFFNPIRYTSLGLSVCEAMMVGLPIVGLATTEMVSVIQNGASGYLATDPHDLIAVMRRLAGNRDEAQALGAAARRHAMERFHIKRFARDWDMLLRKHVGRDSMLRSKERRLYA